MLFSVLIFLQTAPGEGGESGGAAAMPSLGSPEGRFEDAQVSLERLFTWKGIISSCSKYVEESYPMTVSDRFFLSLVRATLREHRAWGSGAAAVGPVAGVGARREASARRC